MRSPERDSLDFYAAKLLELAERSSCKPYEAKAHLYLSSYPDSRFDSLMPSKLRHLDLAEKIARSLGNDTLLCYIYNQRGIWEMNSLRNLVTAQYWFNESLKKAEAIGMRKAGIPAEMNISETFRLLGDTTGVKYDTDLLDYALQKGDSLKIFSAALHCAWHYSSSADYEKLSPYLERLASFERRFPGTVAMVKARFHYNRGDWAEALREINQAGSCGYVDFKLLHAQILNKTGKWRESDNVLGQIEYESGFMSNPEYLTWLDLKTSNAFGSGRYKAADSLRLEYNHFRDSVEAAKSLDLQKRYSIEYQVLHKDRTISEQKARMRNILVVAAAIIALFLVVILAMVLWIRRRNQLYRDIVAQSKDAVSRENELKSRLARHEKTHAETSPTKISEDKIACIYERVRQLCEEKEVWRDTAITRESLAEMAGCNRTYLSEVIKFKTGMEYSQFMNSCRIREAVRIMSSGRDEVPLSELARELGFLSYKTFNVSFKETMGMSPSAFRKIAKTT